jgi:ABC-type antimicrobial peptide transport system ATPase subunit
MRIDELEPRPTVAEPLEIPAELQDSVMRHQAHLAALVTSLRAAGMQEDVVEISVRSLVDSYAQELTLAIRTMMEGPDHA